MTSFLFVGIVTGLVIAISVLIDYFVSIFDILFKKPIPTKGAVEIDPNEHIYAHPDSVGQSQDAIKFHVHTIYEGLLHGLQVGDGGRPQFSYRQSSDRPFQSYSYK